jgi:hypothetical protein
MQSKQPIWRLILVVLLVSVGCGGQEQSSATSQQGEQTSFDAEPVPGEAFVKRPVVIPDSALQVLRDSLDPDRLHCIREMGTAPEQVPASWFVASEIHLNGPNEVDLIVLPNVPRIEGDKFPATNAGGCLLGAHGGGLFWVLRPGVATGTYALLLVTNGDGLKVLTSRTNGYRDIQTGTGRTGLLYKFTALQYQLAEKRTEPLK